jgi:hypothetical protein
MHGVLPQRCSVLSGSWSRSSTACLAGQVWLPEILAAEIPEILAGARPAGP